MERALRPSVLADEDLSLRADHSREIAVDPKEAVEIELPFEFRSFPDDRIDEGVVGDVGIAQSLLLRLTAMVDAFSGVMDRNCIGLT